MLGEPTVAAFVFAFLRAGVALRLGACGSVRELAATYLILIPKGKS
jgi:hypothetical protein